jgi:hypothetical protein
MPCGILFDWLLKNLDADVAETFDYGDGGVL